MTFRGWLGFNDLNGGPVTWGGSMTLRGLSFWVGGLREGELHRVEGWWGSYGGGGLTHTAHWIICSCRVLHFSLLLMDSNRQL